jgi:hypothetical protein
MSFVNLGLAPWLLIPLTGSVRAQLSNVDLVE